MPRASAATSPCSRRCPSRWCAVSARRSARCSPGCTATHGVDLRRGVDGASRSRATGRVERVRARRRRARSSATRCSSRSASVPTTDWLEGSGLTLDNGVVCDATLHAAPDVVAAGDVCRWPNPRFDDEVMRIEHWTNAAEQGVHAARSLLAGDAAEPFAPVPFVWCDQYDVKIQCAGRFGGEDRMEVVHGTADDDRFVAIFERHGRISGVLGFSQPRRVIQYRKLIADRAVVRRGARVRCREPLRWRPGTGALRHAPVRAGHALGRALLHRARDDDRGAPGVRAARLRRRRHRRRHRRRRVRVRCSGPAPVRRPDRRPVGPPAARDRRRRASSCVSMLLYVTASGHRRRSSGFRLLGGIGEAAFFVGAGHDDHRPRADRTARRGDLVLVGRGVQRARVRARDRRGGAERRGASTRCGSSARVCAGAAGRARAVHPRDAAGRRAARRDSRSCTAPPSCPGITMFLGLIALAGYTAFLKLYGDDRRASTTSAASSSSTAASCS